MEGDIIAAEDESWTKSSIFTEEECNQSAAETSQKSVCKFYSEGKCRFGEKCYNLHIGEVNETKVKVDQNIERERENEKKPPLRTAGDVRKRIQWDDELPSHYFVVGYMDRFSGIEEQPFCAFSWEHLANAQMDDLAIPQHRIQYFKYRGTKVWDKNERLDHVFGSSGNGKTILEAMSEIDDQLPVKESTEDSDSDCDIVVNAGSIVSQQKIQEKVDERLRATHFLCIRVDTNGEVAAGVKEVQTTIFEGDRDLSSCAMPRELLHVTLSMIKCESAEAIERVKQILTELEDEIKALPEYNPNGNPIEAKGLSTFGARVLFCNLQVTPLFTRVVEILQSKIDKAEDIVITNEFEFIPHMTILKVNRKIAKERRSKYINSGLYSEHIDKHLGNIDFNNINFCIINDYRGLDRFYLTHNRIQF